MEHITADTLSGLHGVANQIKILGLALSHQKIEDEQLESRNLFQKLSLLLVMGNSSTPHQPRSQRRGAAVDGIMRFLSTGI